MNYETSALTVIADPMRRAILDQLLSGPKSVRELTDAFSISQPAISQHLKKLGAANLVSHHAKGASNIYQINPAGLTEIRAILDRYWAAALDNFKDLAEREAMQ